MYTVPVIPAPRSCRLLGSVCPVGLLEKYESIITEEIREPEGYRLIIGENGAKAYAQTETGLLHAERTLRQLHDTAKGGSVPCMEIEDAPAFAYRSFMVDSSRHMQTVQELKTLIHACSEYKFNTFHWHLSDDQGFRFGSEEFPALTEKGAWRPGSYFGREKDDTPYGGFYTKDEMREIVSFCAERGITVVPEFDVPGHTSAMLYSYPSLRCGGKGTDIKMTQGVFSDILCAGKDETLRFLYDLFDEVCEVFPGGYFHLGGDEAPKKQWKACPDCQRRIRENGLSDEEALQGWLTKQLAAYLHGKGKQVICWNETLQGGDFGDGVIIQNWMDKNRLCSGYAVRGGKLIYSDFFTYYTDYPYAMTPLKKTYMASPYPDGTDDIARKNVIGIDIPIWCEYVRDFERIGYLTFPRFCAAAETGWSGTENKDYSNFRTRMEGQVFRLRLMGIPCAPEKEWDPVPAARLGGTAGFFLGNITGQTVKDLIFHFGAKE